MYFLKSTRVWLLTVVILAFSFTANASHYRYGNISWERVAGGSGYRVQFKVSLAWRKTASYQWNTSNVGSVVSAGTSINFGDGTYGSPNLTVTAVNTAEDWFYGEATIIHDYNGPGVFNPNWNSCCRISSLVNNSGASFIGKTSIAMSAPYGTFGENLSSPVTSISPIVNMSANLNPASIQIPAIDPDGDPVVFRLANPGEAGSGTQNPAGLSIDAHTGVLSFNTYGKYPGQLYNVIVVAEDNRGGLTMIDFIVRIVQQSTPPVFVSPTPSNGINYQLQPGQSLNFTVSATDADPGDIVTINAVGLPPGSAMSPTLPTSGTQAAQSSFSWTPTASNLGTSVVNFTATDAAGTQVSTSLSITVSLKPQFASSVPGHGSLFCIEPGSTYSEVITASDPDPTDVVSISYSGTASGTFSTSMPTAAANPTSTTFSYTPSAVDWGTQTASFTATDSYGDVKVIEWTFLVNHEPQITSTPTDQVNVGQTYTYLLTTTDADIPQGDEVEIETASYPAWMTLTDNNNGTWTLSGSPTLADVGVHSVEIEIEDQLNHYQGTHCGHNHQDFDVEVIPCNLQVSGLVSDVSCNGGADGAVDFTVTGANGVVTYAWSNGATTEDVSGLSAGTYSVTITDSYGCSESASFTVAEPTAISYTYSSTPILCYGGLSQESITINGGTPPYTVTNQNGGALVIGLGEGVTAHGNTYATTYNYTITDANGCTASFTAVISQPDALSATYAVSSYVGGWNVSCSGSNDGWVDVTVSGGTAPYSYSWSDGSSSEDASGLYAGTYDVTITDANGCSTSIMGIHLNEPTPVTSTLSVTPSIGVNPGGEANTIYIGYGPQSLTLDMMASGGTAPYTYAWSPSSSLSSASGASVVASPTSSTTYTVVATDANGCTSTQSVTINVVDVRCGKKGNKVLVCKVPPGNPGNAHTICVSPNAVAAHLATGSYLGNCTNKTEWSTSGFSVFPNPSGGVITLSFDLTEDVAVQYQVVDMRGSVITDGLLDETAGNYQVQLDLSAQPSGMYFVRFISDNEVVTERISIAR